MSRSRGGRSFTTLSPIRSSPSLMSSRPAIIRRAVVLPQPDGPTKITNSPSAISRLIFFTASVPSGYRFVTSFRTISATALSFGWLREGFLAHDDTAVWREAAVLGDGPGGEHDIALHRRLARLAR